METLQCFMEVNYTSTELQRRYDVISYHYYTQLKVVDEAIFYIAGLRLK